MGCRGLGCRGLAPAPVLGRPPEQRRPAVGPTGRALSAVEGDRTSRVRTVCGPQVRKVPQTKAVAPHKAIAVSRQQSDKCGEQWPLKFRGRGLAHRHVMLPRLELSRHPRGEWALRLQHKPGRAKRLVIKGSGCTVRIQLVTVAGERAVRDSRLRGEGMQRVAWWPWQV